MADNSGTAFDGGKVLADVATNLVKDAVSSGWNKVKKYFKDLDAKDSIDCKIAYENYLENTKERNSKIKTLIYRRIPQDLYSFYECIGVQEGRKIIDTKTINNLLDVGNKLVITGTGGIGKSILFKHLFLNAIENTELVPVLLELRKFNNFDLKEISLYDAVLLSLKDNGFALEDQYFEYSLSEGGYVILLDGFDEVNREKASKVASEIRRFSDKYNKNKFIVSSRPTDVFIGWNDYHELRACSLTKEQALSLISKIEFDPQVKTVFYDALDSSLFVQYKSFASNPLLLTIMLLTFTNHAAIPEKINDFYEEAFLTLFNMHDATKDCYVRDTRTALGCDDFKTVFSYICFKSYFANEYEFTDAQLHDYIQKAREKFDNIHFNVDDFQEDLLMSVCMLVKDGLSYRFSHRSFQEYFAACYTCKLTDDIQKKLLSGWLSESASIFSEEYFSMLFNLQPEKVNKIILSPGIKKLKDLYDKKRFSVELLDDLFAGLSVRNTRGRNTKDTKAELSIPIKNRYLCNIFRFSCKLNGFINDTSERKSTGIAERIKSGVKTKTGRTFDRYSFKEILTVVDEKELLEELDWINQQLLFAFSVLEKNKSNDLAKKRKVSSIIEEL